jgi:acyl transferase domain-containing protein/NADPH:quinone reductase-like Zn-dependent oxidoreductase/short-subunit dehydrogenase
VERFKRGETAPTASERESRSPAFLAGAEAPEPIAIVGLGCRLPGGANDPEAFWRLLCDGVDAITEVPKDRWDIQSLYHPDWRAPGRIHQRHGGFVEDIDKFDAAFFGISPKEARTVDPQQRMLLEVAHQALENAGIPPFGLGGREVGVYVGIMNGDYHDLALAPSEWRVIGPTTHHGGTASIAANRLSYVFDLRGPSMAIDTACSSSLVALHLAVTALRRGECELALVAGVNGLLGPAFTIGLSQGGFLSARGRCQAFSAKADGYVRSEGAVALALEPLGRARRLGHPVLAVVRDTAVNQDGRTTGLSLPSEEAQAALLGRVYGRADVHPVEVDYVEAHGTGTAVGDPIEARALGRELGRGRALDDPVYIGSVKTNVGHLESAAGVVSLLKVVLAMRHGEIPASLHAEQLNPNIPFRELRLELVRERRPWPDRSGVRGAGVNGFGYGGTNAHVILEGVANDVQAARAEPEREPCVVTLSARSPEALRALAGAYREQAEAGGPTPTDVAWTTTHHRDHHPHRAALVVRDDVSWRTALEQLASGESMPGIVTGRAAREAPRVAFVCSGQGPQWWGMGRELRAESAVFRDTVKCIASAMAPHASWSLLEELGRDATHSRVHETWLTQPTLFAIQVGLAAVWRDLGVAPEAVVGHSVGEVAAAVIAGALTLEEGSRVIVERGRIQQRASGAGRMLAVGLDEAAAQERLVAYEGRVSVAAINRPELVAVAGETEDVEALAKALTAEGVFNRFVAVQVPFHSHLMDPLKEELDTVLGPIRGRDTSVPLYSTVTGGVLAGAELGGDYWFRNVRQPVRFVAAIRAMVNDGLTAFVELSPHPILSPGIEEVLTAAGESGTTVTSLRRGEPELQTVLGALGGLYVAGVPIRPVRSGRRVGLPTYPWQREHYWCETAEGRSTRLARRAHPFIKRQVSARSQDAHLFELDLDPEVFGFLKDHRIDNALVLPGAASLEAALACGREAFGRPVSLCDVRFERALFLPEEPDAERRGPDVRLEIDGDDGRFRIVAEDGSGDWTRHVSGRIDHWGDAAPGEGEVVDVVAARRLGRPIASPESFYSALARRGYGFGPVFRRLAEPQGRVFEVDGPLAEWVSAVAPLEAGEPSGFCVHPAVLDTCFQALLGATAQVSPNESRLALPTRVARLRVASEVPSQRLTVLAHVVEASQDRLRGHAWLIGEAGHVVVEVEGFEARYVCGRIPRALTDCSWDVKWVGSGPPAVRIDGAVALAGSGALVDALAGQLTERGVAVVQLGEGCENLPPRVRQLVLLEPAGARGGLELDAESLKRLYRPTLGSVLETVNRVAAGSVGAPPRVVIVTCGAMGVSPRDRDVNLAQSAVWGLGRVLANEYPALGIRLVDLPATPGVVELVALAQEIERASSEVDVALRGEERLTPVLEASSTQALGPSVDGRQNPHYRLRSAQPGLIDSLYLEVVEPREPGPGEVAIAVEAAGLNFHDVMLAMDLLPSGNGGDEFGTECAGKVVAVGAGVDHLVPGQDVVAGGSEMFGGVVLAPAALVWPRPASWSAVEAAGLLAVFGTAYLGLTYLARLAPGERVLIHSAAGGLGLAAVQIAQRAGARVLATAGTAEKRAYLRTLGVEAVFDSRSSRWPEDVLAWTGGLGVDVVLNSLSGPAIGRGIACLARHGRFIELGKSDIVANNRIGLAAFDKNLSFHAVDLHAMIRERPQWLAENVLTPVVELAAAGELQPLPTQSTAVGEIAAAFGKMAQGRHIGKLVVEMTGEAPISVRRGGSSFRVRPNRTYLVTGGTRGFGLALAKRLVERGARHLMLWGRTGTLDAQATELVTAWRQAGVTVDVAAVDVGARAEVADALMRSSRDGLPPLGGVAHGAVALADGPAAELDAQRMWHALSPKAGGALNLHQATLGEPLDWFLLISSVSALLGNPGQANYCAANMLLEGLGSARRAAGLPATVVELGVLGETGFVARNERVKERLRQIGLQETPLEVALALVEVALVGGVELRMAARADWSAVVRYLPGTRARLARTLSEDDELPATTKIGDCEPASRSMRVAAGLRVAIGKMIGAAPERLPEDTPITELGIDSLVTAQLTSWIQHEHGVRMTTMQLLRGPSIRQLAKDIVDAQRVGVGSVHDQLERARNCDGV